ncbi:MAG: hypothetical protein R3C44_14160 [Chloroflexota bacterium]
MTIFALARRPTPLAEVTLNDRLLDSSLGVIVHSAFAQRHIQEKRPDIPTAVIPQLIAPYATHSRRAELGLSDDVVLFGSVGQITAASDTPELLANAAGSCWIRGSPHTSSSSARSCRRRPWKRRSLIWIWSHITRTGYRNLAGFVDWTTTPDVVLNLRYPTLGETSASALRAMATGRPVIVSDHGWYSELPDEAVVKRCRLIRMK